MPSVAVVGAGPAGLMAAEVLARAGLAVTVFDRMASVGRKFLLAGRGGLNITHSEELPRFLARYGDGNPRLCAAIESFPPTATRAWCDDLGQKTFIGSSGRVFPNAFKSSPLLRAWLRRLMDLGVQFKLRHRWIGWDTAGALMLETPEGARCRQTTGLHPGAGRGELAETWSRRQLGRAACGARHRCSSAPPRELRVSGAVVRSIQRPLCRAAIETNYIVVPWPVVRGEGMITRHGIEGGAIYALSAALRDTIATEGEATLQVSLRPDLPTAELQRRLEAPRGKQSLATFLRKAVALSPVAIGLLHEVCPGKLATLDAPALASLIHALPLRLTGTLPIDRAISTAGGVPSPRSMIVSCFAGALACSSRAKCSTGRRRPAVTCCKPVSPRA